jgi:hypothetical protein
VGEPLRSQLIITSKAQPGSTAIVLSEVKIVFEGGLRPIWLIHQQSSDILEGESAKCQIQDVDLRDSAHSTDLSSPTSPTGGIVSLVGKCDLSLYSGQSKVYNLTSVPRESGDIKLDSITLLLEEETFSLGYVVPGHDHEGGVLIKQSQSGPKLRKFGFDRNVTAARIQPKPPKIRIETPNLSDIYYTDETVELAIDVINNEDEAAVVDIEVRLLGGADHPATIAWIELDDITSDLTKETSQDGTSYLGRRAIGKMANGAVNKLRLAISDTSYPFDYELEITATYHLISDAETPIIKATTIDISFVRPFEGHPEFLPRLHPDPWPNFFYLTDDVDLESGKPIAHGIPQRYSLNAKVIPLAQESLVVEDVYPTVVATNGEITCSIHPPTTPFHISPLPADSFGEFNFTLDVRKLHLEDRRPAALHLHLLIRWHRSSLPTQSNTTRLPIPRFVVPYEPRVIATSIQDALSTSGMPGLIHMGYTIENPSMHTLPFALNMEASEEFAFSGAKTRTLHLLPYSRRTVRYTLLSGKRGVWVRPRLEVLDTYFNTRVKVFAGVKGMKRPGGGGQGEGERGILVWVEDEEGKERKGEGGWVVGSGT